MLTKALASRHSNPNTSGGDTVDATGEDVQRIADLQIVQSLGSVLLEKRQEALNWRAQTGIEEDWQEDEEFYQAVDRANPEGDSNVGKPVSADGGAENRPVTTGRSSVFIPITRAYVDAASARVADMLLPNDDAPWQIRATPQPDMVTSGGLTPTADAVQQTMPGATFSPAPPMPGAMNPQAAMMQPGPSPSMGGKPPGPVAPGSPGMGGATGMPGPAKPPEQAGAMSRVSSQITPALSPEDKAAERANTVISDWLVECQWHAETRKVIEDSALIGTGVLKGPVPMMRKMVAYEKDPVTSVYRMTVKWKIVPVSRRVNPRNFWTDPAGGENHQAGSYCWELDNIGTRALRDLLQDDSYIAENVMRALREGPGAKTGADRPTNSEWAVDVGATFPLWYFYGDIDKKTMIAAGVEEEMLPEGEDEAVAIGALVIMVNDLVVKVTQTPLDAGGFPYDMFPWQRRPGIPQGKGVARQIRTPQRMLNAGVRAEMDNGGLTSGPQWAIRKQWVEAVDGNNSTITPRKGWHITENAPPNVKLEDCISFLNITSNTGELERIIDRAMRFAEDATGLPMLMQGQQGDATNTATGMTILNNNGSTVLRRIARTFDDHITEPHIRRYYYWLLANEGNDDAKGDFQIDARGSTYLVDRELQAQNLNQLFPMFAQHPDVHPGRLAEEVAIANRISYKRIMLTDAEKKARDSQPPQKPEQVQIAELRAASAEKIAQATLGQREESDKRKAQIAEGQLQQQVEQGLGELAAKLHISENDLKAMLTVAVMNHQGQREARDHQSQQAGIDRTHERTSAIEGHEREMASTTPPAEPRSRAPAGGAFTG